MATDAFVALGLVVVEISDEPVEPGRTFTDKTTGMQKPLPARQTGWLWSGKRHPIEVKLDVDDKAGPYRPGIYLLGGDIFNAAKFGRVEFNDRRLRLVRCSDAIVALGGDIGKLKAA